MGIDGRRNWPVAGMSSNQTVPSMTQSFSVGAGGAIHREKTMRKARK